MQYRNVDGVIVGSLEQDDPVWIPGLPNISPGNLPRVSSDPEWVYIDDGKIITSIPRKKFFEFIKPLINGEKADI